MEFVYQPSTNNRLGEFLNANLGEAWTHFRAAVAFVKRSGTQHIEGKLVSFAKDKDVEILVGIDHRGTSLEGLQSLLTAVSPNGRVIVFHNPGWLTFHPKVYLFKSSNAAEVYIGSGNLTEGGLYANYEAGCRLTLNLDSHDDLAMLQSIEEVLDRWADLSTGTAHPLNASLLAQLSVLGLTPTEVLLGASSRQRNTYGVGTQKKPRGYPFTPKSEPGAPSVTRRGKGISEAGGAPQDTSGSNIQPPLGFVMTLQKTDVGVGQTSPGTSRRSPEVFIPLRARDTNPTFWNWPSGFADDPQMPGKRDRQNVQMKIGSQTISVNMMTWPVKHDFRLRSEWLRSAGNIGDILRMERVDSAGLGYEYYVEIIPQGTTQYPVYLALCTEPVRNSLKRFGYY